MSAGMGRVVWYRLTEQDAKDINRRRTTGGSIKLRLTRGQWHKGAQAHIGTTVEAGDEVTGTVVKVQSDGGVNIQCLLNGNDQFWAVDKTEGTEPGNWRWPPRE